jgi:hypothetical protein
MRPLTQLIAFTVALALAAPMASLAAANADSFLPGIADVPLFTGLAADSETGVDFDTPAGRIVETVATGLVSSQVTRESVTNFYQSTLPQLGWVRTGTLAFEREGERLTLSLNQSAGVLAVRFKLTPK